MNYFHTLDPVLLQIYGDIGIRWYGLSYLAGFFVAYLLMLKFSSLKLVNLDKNQIGDLVTYAAFGTVIGGRLGYVFFYQPHLLTDFRPSLPFWGVLAVNEGGMASHGGMMGIAFACFLFHRKHKTSLLQLFDLVTVSGAIGIAFGRLANFINGELLGRVVETTHWLTVQFPSEILTWSLPQKVEKLKGAASSIGVSASDWSQISQSVYESSTARQKLSEIAQKLFVESQNGNVAVIEALSKVLPYRYPSQLYAALFEGLLVWIALLFVWAVPRREGVVGATFVVLYAGARIFTEQFRTPDSHLGFQWLGLTRGQWLSVGMLALGLALLAVWSLRKKSPLQPGWLKRNV